MKPSMPGCNFKDNSGHLNWTWMMWCFSLIISTRKIQNLCISNQIVLFAQFFINKICFPLIFFTKIDTCFKLITSYKMFSSQFSWMYALYWFVIMGYIFGYKQTWLLSFKIASLTLGNLYFTWIIYSTTCWFSIRSRQNKTQKKHRMTHNNIQSKQLKIIKTG